MVRHLLIAYSWSVNNIGDMGITPGLLNLIDRDRPELPVSVLTWQPAADPGHAEAKARLQRYRRLCTVEPMPFFERMGAAASRGQAWPRLLTRWGAHRLESFRKGILTADDSAALVDDLLGPFADDLIADLRAEVPSIARAIEEAGFVLYNSGTTLNFGRLGVRNLWGYTLPLAMPLILARRLGLPYGISAQSFDALEWPMELLYRTLFRDARFVYCRDTDSLRYLEQKRLTNACSGFRPDSTFFFQGLDEPWADHFLAAQGLTPERYACVLARISAATAILNDPTGGAVSAARQDEQMRKLAHFITEWVRRTGCKALLCHETRDTLETLKAALWERLPADVRPAVVYLDSFWSSEQAYSVFRRARLVVSMEMHSVIMAVNVGTPVLHDPFDECGRKKTMMRDIGLGDWLLDIDSCGDEALIDAALAIHHDWESARQRLQRLRPALEVRARTTLSEVWLQGRWD